MSAPRAVFILGCPRSGTSVFFRALAGHPGLCTTTNVTRRFRARFALVRAAELLGARHRPVEADRFWRAFRSHDRREFTADDLTADQRAALERLVASHCRHFRRPLFVSKWPGHSMRVGWTAAALPQARFIHCVRDGRDVAASILRECRKSGQAWSYMGRELWPELGAMEWAAYAGALWSRVTRTCAASLAALEPSRCLTLRYERFMARHLDALAEVADFCGLPFGAEHHGMALGLDARSGSWRRDLDEREQALMLEQAGGLLAELGYVDRAPAAGTTTP